MDVGMRTRLLILSVMPEPAELRSAELALRHPAAAKKFASVRSLAQSRFRP